MTTVAYLGPPGTFTDAAVDALAGDTRLSPSVDSPLHRVPATSPMEALAMVRDGTADCAVVPFENSVDGTVSPTVDSLAEGQRLQIFGEVELDIAFDILVRPGTTAKEVRTLRTHPIAAAQVRRWVSENLVNCQIETASSTAAGAAAVACGEADATAAPARAGELLGLESLASSVADIDGARTRFVLVGPPAAPPPRTGSDRTCVVFGVEHEPHALVQALTEISVRGLDLTRVESRPTRRQRFTYLFHLDIVGHIDDPVVAEALTSLHRRTASLRYLGSWPVRSEIGTPPPDPSEALAWLEEQRHGGSSDQ